MKSVKTKFKVGDVITPKQYYQGFENAQVVGIREDKNKRYYVLKIMRGIATIPISAEVGYKLKKD